MANQPWRLATLQATLSLLAILVIYLTLLRPGDAGPLIDVEAPWSGGGGRVELVQPQPEPRRSPRSHDRRGSPPAGLAAGPPATVASLPPAPPAASPPTGGAYGPSDDQYAGSLARIALRVGAPID